MITAKIDPKYEIVKKLREGGMGALYLVRHRLLDELRVIKVLRSQLTADEDLRQRFLREARIAIQLRHPNIAQLYDFAVDDEGTAYIVLEYIDGITLEEFARQPEARHLPLTLAIAQQALRALGYLHRKGFVHRDIAPDNLMLTRDVDGEPLVKLIDLGIVKILKGEGKGTATSLYLGKPKYSSPEQLISQNIDARSDLYSFGVLLYELATGVYPIHGHDLPSLITGHLHREPVDFAVSDPGGVVPESLRQVILAALAKRPEDRIPSAEEFARRLAGVATAIAPAAPEEEHRLLDAAREGAQRAREAALAEAESAIRDRLERRDFAAAREQLAQAIERLGNDTRLASLARAIESSERARLVADAESGRLEQLADEAERALDQGELAEAMSKVFEIVARQPQHPRGRALQERIDRLRREQEAGAGAAPGATAATVLAARAASAATLSPRRTPASDEITAPVTIPEETPSPRPGTLAPAAGGAPARRRPVTAIAAVVAVAAAVAVGGWLLFQALTGDGGPPGPGLPTPSPPQAGEAYAAAVAALARGDAAEAERRLRDAFALDPSERPGYLPQARYGLLLAGRGDCAGAERLFASSEAQAVAPADPLWSEVTAARGRCAGGGVEPLEIAAELARAEEDLRRVLGQLADLRRQKTVAAVADLWARNPSLGAEEKRVEGLLAEADRALAAARARRDLAQVYEAGDRTADARSLLKKLLAAALAAAGADLERLDGS